jgi:hypothetical protein
MRSELQTQQETIKENEKKIKQNKTLPYLVSRVKRCEQVAMMEWVGSLSSYLRQSQISYSSLVQSIMWPCVSRLQSVVAIAGPRQDSWLGPPFAEQPG